MIKPWDELTEAEREEANEYAWIRACDYLRAAEGDRDQAQRTLDGDIAEQDRIIKRARRARATKRDRLDAEYAANRRYDLWLANGFIQDVEI